MARVDYNTHLKSLGWKQKRLDMLFGDNAKCYCCGIEKWKYRIWLCMSCGNKFYGDRWNYEPVCNCDSPKDSNWVLLTDGKEYFQLHHLTYKNFGKEKEGDLIVLCEDCHRLVHNLINMHQSNLNIKTAPEYLKKQKNREVVDGAGFVRYILDHKK